MVYLIGGGSGFVGRALVRELLRRGIRCIVVGRKSRKVANSAKSLLQATTWDVLQTTGLDSECIGVVNLAGANLLDFKARWTEEYKQEIYHSRVWTTRTLARLISESDNPPKAFVTASGVGYYPPSTQMDYNERYVATRNGGDFFSRLCIDWEAASRIPSDSAPTRVCNVRLGVVLGRTGGMIANLIAPFYAGLGGRMGSGNQPLPWIHIDDVVGIFMRLLMDDKAKGCFNGVAPEFSTNADFAAAFGRALNRPALLPTPAFVLKSLLGAERASVVLEGQKVCPMRLVELGYEFKYPNLDAACAEFSRLSYTSEENTKLFD